MLFNTKITLTYFYSNALTYLLQYSFSYTMFIRSLALAKTLFSRCTCI